VTVTLAANKYNFCTTGRTTPGGFNGEFDALPRRFVRCHSSFFMMLLEKPEAKLHLSGGNLYV
jgi:hypothetical protein